MSGDPGGGGSSAATTPPSNPSKKLRLGAHPDGTPAPASKSDEDPITCGADNCKRILIKSSSPLEIGSDGSTCLSCGLLLCLPCFGLDFMAINQRKNHQSKLLTHPAVRLVCKKCQGKSHLPASARPEAPEATGSPADPDIIQAQISSLTTEVGRLSKMISGLLAPPATTKLPPANPSYADKARARLRLASSGSAFPSLLQSCVAASEASATASREKEDAASCVIVAGILPEASGAPPLSEQIDALCAHLSIHESRRPLDCAVLPRRRPPTTAQASEAGTSESQPPLCKLKFASPALAASFRALGPSLKTSDKYKSVFLRPARTRDQLIELRLASKRRDYLNGARGSSEHLELYKIQYSTGRLIRLHRSDPREELKPDWQWKDALWDQWLAEQNRQTSTSQGGASGGTSSAVVDAASFVVAPAGAGASVAGASDASSRIGSSTAPANHTTTAKEKPVPPPLDMEA